MLDEAHELKKQGLLILAILRNYVKKHGSQKKLIVTSATLDTKLFEDYFQGLNTMTIEALTPTYDVETYYTQFPDLESNVIENTACHLKVIFDVGSFHAAHQEEL
jgi:HrpA-like RNA helicase